MDTTGYIFSQEPTRSDLSKAMGLLGATVALYAGKQSAKIIERSGRIFQRYPLEQWQKAHEDYLTRLKQEGSKPIYLTLFHPQRKHLIETQEDIHIVKSNASSNSEALSDLELLMGVRKLT